MKTMPKLADYFAFRQERRLVTILVCVAILAWILTSVLQPAWAVPLCSEVGEGEICIPDGGPSLPGCYDFSGNTNPNLSEGQLCSGDGDICSIREGVVYCRNLEIGGCFTTELGALVPRACDYSDTLASAFAGVTEKAVQNVLLDHALPASDDFLVREYARGLLRASAFAEILRIIDSGPDRVAKEQEIVDFYTENLRELRIRQAQISESEYARFASDPCSYQPPEGFNYTPSASCSTNLGFLFGNNEHPSLEEFKRYGVMEVTREDVLKNPEALGIAVGLEHGLAIGLGLGLIGAGAVFAVLITTPALATLLVGVTAPYALVSGWSFAAGAFTGATGIIGGIAGIAGAVGIIIFAIVGSIFIILSFTNYADFEREVTSLVESSQIIPDLRTEMQTQRGVYDLHHVFIKSTQPEHVPVTPVPAPAAEDRFFEVKDAEGRRLTIAPSIFLYPVNVEGDSTIIATETRLHGGWFVPSIVYSPQSGVLDTTSALSLSLAYKDWDGNPQIAWRRGHDFVIPQRGESNEVPIVSHELAYLDENGVQRIASIFVDDTPPIITASILGTMLNGNGWYVSDVGVEWTLTDDESDILSSSGCEPATVSIDGETTLVCTASSAGGESVTSVIIKRDAAPPSITGTRTPNANTAGWNNTDVTVTFSCSDATSGVATCSPAETVSQEGGNQSVVGQAIDVAGNVGTTTVGEISIDKTPPAIRALVPADQAVFVLAESVFSDWSVVDDLSGVATTAATAPPGGVLDTSKTGQFAFEVFAEDAAGNSAQLTHRYTVLSPAEATARLADRIADLGLPRGTTNALTGRLKEPSPQRSTTNVALIGKLQAFINFVNAQSGKSIPTDIANELIVEAQKIIGGVQSIR